jgi:2-polyprenyl-3-methyl-5-hydroxy-6-metoxy-1,4-benzoquinol methylase
MKNSYTTNLTNKASFYFEMLSHEKTLSRIILDSCTKENNYNLIWIRRWKNYRIAFYPNFWKKHFHIHSIINSKCLTGKILDFGCGSGHIDLILAKKGMTIHGIDISTAAIDIANYYRNHLPKKVKDRVQFTATDIKSFNPGFRFDSCFLTDVLEHLPLETARDIVIELRRLLVDDAQIFISVPYEKNYFDPDHCNFYYSLEEFDVFCTAIGLNVKTSRIDKEYHVIDSIVSISGNEEPFDLRFPQEMEKIRIVN